MRITASEHRSILDVVAVFDPDATVYLFGSRADDGRKGGDIDLLILSRRITFSDRRRLRLRLYDAIGEQKIDILLAPDTKDPMAGVAMSEGVRL
jgi:uncharacterized protein